MKVFRFFVSYFLASGALTLWSTADPVSGQTNALIASKTALHVGIVVADIDEAIGHWTALLELPEKPTAILSTGHPSKPTRYKGHPANARAKLAFFQLDNIQIELIQPVGDGPSDWHEFLATQGAGVHHLAFKVSDLSDTEVPKLAAAGLTVKQEGGWDGGEYVYLDSRAKLGVTLELLETFLP